MVKSINEPHATAEVSTDMPESNNELPPAAAIVTEDGSTVLGGEVIPPQPEPEPVVEPEPEPEPDPEPIKPVAEDELTKFIESGRPN
jgi:hypothetical protein